MRQFMFGVGAFAVLTYTAFGVALSDSAKDAENVRDRLKRIANNKNVNRDERAAAVFELFRNQVKPGDDCAAMRRTLGAAEWLEETKLWFFPFLGDQLPVSFEPDTNRTYCLHLFPGESENADTVIYFVIAGKSKIGNETSDGNSFLRGERGSTGDTYLKEFALCRLKARSELFKMN